MPLQSLDDLLCSRFGPLRIDPPDDLSIRKPKTRLYKGLESCTSWKDFTYNNMRRHLDSYLKLKDNFYVVEPGPLTNWLSSKRNLTHLIVQQYAMVVDQAIHLISKEGAQSSSSGPAISPGLVMRSGWIIPASGTEELDPDWAGAVLDSDEPDGLNNLLPGDTEYTRLEFHESDKGIKTDDGDFGAGKETRLQKESDYKFACIGHVSACAYYLNTRYAYIITPEQAIFIRISRGKVWTSGHDAKPDLDIPEISVVPRNGREDGMTVLHALLWIHYLACLERDIRDEYEPLCPNL